MSMSCRMKKAPPKRRPARPPFSHCFSKPNSAKNAIAVAKLAPDGTKGNSLLACVFMAGANPGLPSCAEEDRTDELAIEQHLARQRACILGGLRQDDAAIGDGRQHVGEVV